MIPYLYIYFKNQIFPPSQINCSFPTIYYVYGTNTDASTPSSDSSPAKHRAGRKTAPQQLPPPDHLEFRLPSSLVGNNFSLCILYFSLSLLLSPPPSLSLSDKPTRDRPPSSGNQKPETETGDRKQPPPPLPLSVIVATTTSPHPAQLYLSTSLSGLNLCHGLLYLRYAISLGIILGVKTYNENLKIRTNLGDGGEHNGDNEGVRGRGMVLSQRRRCRCVVVVLRDDGVGGGRSQQDIETEDEARRRNWIEGGWAPREEILTPEGEFTRTSLNEGEKVELKNPDSIEAFKMLRPSYTKKKMEELGLTEDEFYAKQFEIKGEIPAPLQTTWAGPPPVVEDATVGEVGCGGGGREACCGRSCGIERIPVFFEIVPMICMNATCSKKGRWTLLRQDINFAYWQRVRMQETSKEMPVGSLPRSLDAIRYIYIIWFDMIS
ncbi:hypothetical protein E3N88_36545 [Mikania micrantha]|uniref:MCM OB domain-containing protein n=1 Tax=Mikania micrantha TaxID=192012 RepID=A0A5N6M417_9ASTR|nr:hypothetical protein E3N88_36545 [Mikania micrantha]